MGRFDGMIKRRDEAAESALACRVPARVGIAGAHHRKRFCSVSTIANDGDEALEPNLAQPSAQPHHAGQQS